LARRKGYQKPKRALLPAEVVDLLKATANDRDRALVATMVFEGLRNNEARTLQVGDIDLVHRTLMVRQGKGRKQRHLELNPELVPLLATIIAERPQEAPVFVGPRGEALTTRRIHQIVAEAAEAAALGKVWPHVLRRTFATTLDEGGVSPRVIQELLAHDSLATTQVYLAVTEERKRQAIRGLRYW
jgi:integrase